VSIHKGAVGRLAAPAAAYINHLSLPKALQPNLQPKLIPAFWAFRSEGRIYKDYG